MTELFLFNAARAEYIDKVIQAYQSYGRGMDLNTSIGVGMTENPEGYVSTSYINLVNCLSCKVVKLPHCYALPEYKTAGAAAADIYAAEHVVIEPGGVGKVPTGWKIALQPGFEMIVVPRSGMFLNYQVDTAGTIDSDYRGEVFVILHNHGKEPLEVQPGDRVAQAKIREVIHAYFNEVTALAETERGEGGFGHTGVRDG